LKKQVGSISSIQTKDNSWNPLRGWEKCNKDERPIESFFDFSQKDYSNC
jgi:hypothetical protein